MSGYHHHQHLA